MTIDNKDQSDIDFQVRYAQEQVEWHKRQEFTSWQHGIALHFFEHEGIQWRVWHEYIIALWQQFGLTPHRAGLGGKSYGYSTYTMSYKGAKKKIESFNYQEVSRYNLIVLKPEFIKAKDCSEFISDAAIRSGWEIGYTKSDKYDHPSKATACFLIDEQIKPFEMQWFLELAKHLQKYTKAKYGYYFRWPLEGAPDVYSGGSDYASTDVESYLRNGKWNSFLSDISYGPVYGGLPYTLEEKALRHIRDIYKLNFISDCHLALPIDAAGTTLRQWIEQGSGTRGELIELNPGFYCWHIASEERALWLRNQLAPSGIIICT
jgi:hypothetical protein